MKKVKVAAIQLKMSADPGRNLKNAAKKVELAAKKGASVICLPELYRTQYFPQAKKSIVEKLAEEIPGDSTRVFSELARKYKVVVVVPIFEKAKNACYNSAVVIDERGKILPTYRKLHIPQDPLFWEKNYFKAGDRGYKIYKTKYATFAVLICYDQWFPEAARMAVLRGAEIIFYPTAIGNVVGYKSPDGDWHSAWETVMRGHAIANGVHVAAVNRVGLEKKLRFWGQSFICDAFGKILARASEAKEQIIFGEIDPAHNRRIRSGWGFFRNRRPDTYEL